jgi:hypothetical protein
MTVRRQSVNTEPDRAAHRALPVFGGTSMSRNTVPTEGRRGVAF